MNTLLVFDTMQVIHIMGLVLSLLGSIMIFGHKLGPWVSATFDFTPVHFLIGLLMSLGLTLVLMNWETSSTQNYVVQDHPIDPETQIPATIQLPKKKVPPPPPPSPKKTIQKLSKVIEFVELEKVEEDPPPMEDQESGPDPVLDTVSYEPAPLPPPIETPDDSNEIITVPDQMPRFPGCELLDADHKQKAECATGQLLQYLYLSLIHI